MSHYTNQFGTAVATAQHWLRTVAEELDDDDEALTYRAVRAWLHGVRDRLPVADAADFAAQLPELLRGSYYEGWQPGHVPIRYTRAEFVERFARECGVTPAEVPYLARTVSRAMGRRMPGYAESILPHLSHELAELFAPHPPSALHELLGT